MTQVSFQKKTVAHLVNDGTNHNVLVSVGDINQDGFVDVLVAGRSGVMAWFENPGRVTEWKKHVIDDKVKTLEAGGLLYDVTGNGYPDFIGGGDYTCNELSWWENPGSGENNWEKHLIYTGANQFHDTIIGDLTNDGRLSLVTWNQGAKSLLWLPVPADPRISPWPEASVIAGDLKEEGLAIADIDGDGQNELIAGTSWYKYVNKQWESYRFATDYNSQRIAVGDIDGDGQLEIVLSEGDTCIQGKPQGGKLGWYKPTGDIKALWEEHILDESLLDPHSLQLGDITGTGSLDIFVGEIGERNSFTEKPPRLIVFANDGSAQFTRHVIDEGSGTHEARLVDTRNKGVLDIVGRPLLGPEKWDIHVWYNER